MLGNRCKYIPQKSIWKSALAARKKIISERVLYPLSNVGLYVQFTCPSMKLMNFSFFKQDTETEKIKSGNTEKVPRRIKFSQNREMNQVPAQVFQATENDRLLS